MKLGASTAALALALSAQQPLASIVGQATDSSGGILAGAQVTVQNVDSGVSWEAGSNSTGYFAVRQLPPGRYSLTVRADGFKGRVEEGVVLEVGQALRRDVQLEIGDITESVIVRAARAELNSEDGRIKGEVNTHNEIQNLPLPNRNFFDLVRLTGGVVSRNGGPGSNFVMNGARADQTNFYADGLSTRSVAGGGDVVRPNFDAVQEFRVETAGYSPEYGRYAGGVLNSIYRSGSNQPHGSLFWFLRNKALDARGFFDRERVDDDRHQFGAAFGGPVRVPSLVDGRTRFFFYFSYEGLRNRRGSTLRGLVPTVAERAGDFSGSSTLIADPLLPGVCNDSDRDGCFTDNRIPASRFHPAGKGTADLYPDPNFSDPRKNYLVAANNETDQDSASLKLDGRMSQRDWLSFRVQRTVNNRIVPFGGRLPRWGVGGDVTGALLGVSYTRVFSSGLMMEANGGYTGSAMFMDTLVSGAHLAGATGIVVPTADPELFGYPRVNVRRYFPIGETPPQPTMLDVSDAQVHLKLAWILGRHDVKWGFGYSGTRYDQPRNLDVRGTYVFSGSFSRNAVSDLLLGALWQSVRRRETGLADLRAGNHGLWVNDDLRLSPRLTLNLGLRWELNRPFVERGGRLSNFIPDENRIIVADSRGIPNYEQRLAASGLTDLHALARDARLPNSLVRADASNFAPRVGVAWRAMPRTVVRSGYGIFYAGHVQGPFRARLADGFPVTLVQRFRAGAEPLDFSDPFPEQSAVTLGTGDTLTSGFEVNPRTGYLQSWNLTIERVLGDATTLETAYVGSKGTRLMTARNLNEPLRSRELFDAGQSFPRPFPRFDFVEYYSMSANSNYHAAQVSLRRRASQGMFLRANYTFSKSIDEASDMFNAVRNTENLGRDRARSSFDHRHQFNFAGVWEVPIGRDRAWLSSARGWRQALLGGWQAGWTTSLLSGAPFTVGPLGSNPDIGESARPNRVRSGEPPPSSGRRGLDFPWFNPEDFEVVPCALSRCERSRFGFEPFASGNSGRNILEEPGLATVNVSLMKNFVAGERHRFQLRLEAFNRVNFDDVETYLGGPETGFLIGARAPRLVQVGLRYQF